MDNITDKNFKYDLEKLDSTSEEFIFVEQFYDTTGVIKTAKNSLIKATENGSQVIKPEIYKVIENNPIKSVDEKSNNLMLFHGTKWKHVDGILKEGFKNSKKGGCGKGVYMTDFSSTALRYTNYCTSCKPIFVNKVLESEKLQTLGFDISKTMKDIDTTLKHPFNKRIYVHRQLTRTTKKIIWGENTEILRTAEKA